MTKSQNNQEYIFQKVEDYCSQCQCYSHLKTNKGCINAKCALRPALYKGRLMSKYELLWYIGALCETQCTIGKQFNGVQCPCDNMDGCEFERFYEKAFNVYHTPNLIDISQKNMVYNDMKLQQEMMDNQKQGVNR